MSLDSEQSGKAFGLVIAAGCATAIGSSAVFFPSLVHMANHKTLAASLGLAAGVMLYVSLVDIYGKAISGFEDAGHDEDKAFIYATLAFFGGIIFMKIVHVGVNSLMRLDVPGQNSSGADKDVLSSDEDSPSVEGAEDPVKTLDDIHRMADELATPEASDEEEAVTEVAKKKLFGMGAATAIAIALHNFPEGLVTFVAYVEDPAVGIALAIGIAIHNIPEGLCVSMPIYYATGKRWKAFFWGVLSGVSEPLGALVGWLILKNNFSGNAYGILFGLVSGIMVFIAVDELLPTAHKHDPDGAITTYAVFAGMLLLAGSLMLFSV